MVAKISILLDQEKNMEANLWKMQEQLNTFNAQGRAISETMQKLHKKLVEVRDERMKAQRIKKADKEEKKE